MRIIILISIILSVFSLAISIKTLIETSKKKQLQFIIKDDLTELDNVTITVKHHPIISGVEK